MSEKGNGGYPEGLGRDAVLCEAAPGGKSQDNGRNQKRWQHLPLYEAEVREAQHGIKRRNVL